MLVQRVSRSALWAVRDARHSVPACRIDVHALGDIESFDSPDDLQEHVTTAAADKCDRITIAIHHDDVRLAISVHSSRRIPFDQSKGGVLLTVETTHNVEAVTIRDRLLATLNRGRPKRSPKPLVSELSPAAPTDDGISAFLWRLGDKGGINWDPIVLALPRALPALFLPLAVQAVPALFSSLYLTEKTTILPGVVDYSVNWPRVALATVVLYIFVALMVATLPGDGAALRRGPRQLAPRVTVRTRDWRSGLVQVAARIGWLGVAAVIAAGVVAPLLALVGIGAK
jgi:hypothetical protein